MEETKTSPSAQGAGTGSEILGVAAGPGPRSAFVDPRPTDLQIFFSLLPMVIGGLAAKSNDIRSTLSTAFVMTREALGQCGVMGTIRVGFVCLDGSMLASMPNNQMALGVQAPVQQQQAGVGGAVQQYPTQGHPGQQPGGGGMVQQYPNYAPQGGQQQPNFGGGSRGVMVAQFPNGTNPPQL